MNNKIYQINKTNDTKKILKLNYSNRKYIIGFINYKDAESIISYKLNNNISFINKGLSKVGHHIKLIQNMRDMTYNIIENNSCYLGYLKIKKKEIDNYEYKESHIYTYTNYLQENKGIIIVNNKENENENELIFTSIMIEPISKYKFMEYL